MKIKQAFIPNSSSSSFMVSPKGELTLTITVDLSKYGTKVTTIEELESAFEEKFETDWKQYEDYEEYYKECVDFIKQKRVIFIGSIGSDYDDYIARMLYDEGFQQFENLNVIMGR